MSGNELVSIITPAYRAARFIDDTVRSVLAQDYEKWEMLIVDDCSPDDTAERVTHWSQRDSRVKLIRQPRNAGPAAARNAAIAASKGRWIAFLDSDDQWMPGKISKQLAFMREAGVPISYTSFRRISEDGSRIGRQVGIPRELSYARLLGNTAMATSTVVIDRDVTGAFEMQPAYYDDFVLWLSLLRRGHSAGGLSEDLMRYRVVGKSVSRNKAKSAKEVWKTYRAIEGLSIFRSARCFISYSAHAWLKYSRF